MAFACPSKKSSLHGFRHLSCDNFSLASSPSEEPVIPSPEIFHFSQDKVTSSPVRSFRLPHRSECAAHLELLETLFVLRQRILRSPALDSVMGTEPVRETKTGSDGVTKTFKDDKLWERRQAKWPIFVEFAVVRFLEWRKKIWKAFSPSVTNEEPQDLPLPPLDIIMVWHALMLNPRLFMNHFQGTPLHKTPMPWEKVHEAVDNREWTFTNSEDDTAAFESATGLGADLVEELSRWPADPADPPKTSRVRAFALEGEPTGARDAGHDSISRKYAACFGTSIDRPTAAMLRDAVIRQTSFVDKMHGLMWIRSPALAGTLRRGIARYENFLDLMKRYPRAVMVPTLDIDLAWHTHQCQALGYAKATKEHVGRFINHDDSIAKDKLSDGFAASRKYFRIQYGREYRVCGCWDCEALVDATEGIAGAEHEPGELDMAEIARSVEETVRYYRAVQRARTAGKPLPKFPMQLVPA
jgi:hypothetical protein